MKDIVYGINQVMSAFESGIKIFEIFLKKDKFENEIKIFKKRNIKCSPISNLNFDDIGISKETNVQGIVALISPKQLLSINELILKSKKERNNPIIVIADKITDPQNIGTICRNIAAFNSQGLIISKHNQSPINSTVHKSSAGNSFFINIALTSSMTNAISKLKNEGFWIVETKTNGDMDLEKLSNYNEPLAIILGSEGKGISPSLSKKADMSLKVKMTGKSESLNVASTSAIILHALQK